MAHTTLQCSFLNLRMQTFQSGYEMRYFGGRETLQVVVGGALAVYVALLDEIATLWSQLFLQRNTKAGVGTQGRNPYTIYIL